MNNTQDKKKPEEIHNLHYYIDHIRYDINNLIKWLVLAILTGLSVGFISSLFARVLKFVTNYRTEHFCSADFRFYDPDSLCRWICRS